MKNRFAFLPVLFATFALVLGLTACGAQPKDEGPDYADDEAMAVIADGLVARSDYIEQQQKAGEDTSTATHLTKAVQTELDVVSPLKDRPFEDSKLQEAVVSYINTLNVSKKVIEDYPTTGGDFYLKWQEVYDERTGMLKTFADKYELTVPERFQATFDEMLAQGGAALSQKETKNAIEQLVESIDFQKTDDGYGGFTYSGVGENTTEYDFKDVGLVVSLYDADGVKAEETYTTTKSWAPGEKVKFEAWSDVDAANIKVSVSYYNVAD